MDSDEGEYLDVTETLREACGTMQIGEIVHRDGFSIGEAMSAIELMNPKMDVGFGERVRAEDVDLDWDLSTEQLVALSDDMLAREASWLEAHTLPQTVYACIYLLRMGDCPNPLLRSVLQMTSARVVLQREIITTAKVYDEEDFVSARFGLQMDSPLTQAEHKQVVDSALAILQDMKGPCVEALISRITFFSLYYDCLSDMDVGEQISEPGAVIANIDKGIQALKDSFSVMPTTEAPGFDERVNWHLLLFSPPRRRAIFTPEEALNYYTHVLEELRNLCLLRKEMRGTEWIQLSGCTHIHALNVLAVYNANNRPSVLTRSIMNSQLMKTAEVDIILVRHAGPNRLGTSLHHAMQFLFRTMCRNRGQQRRKMLVLLSWVARLYTMMPQKNSIGRTVPSSTAQSQLPEEVRSLLEEICCFTSLHHLLLGFECDLYANWELHAVYSNLAHLFRNCVGVHASSEDLSQMRKFFKHFDEGRYHLCSAFEIIFREAEFVWKPNSKLPFGTEKKWYKDRFPIPETGLRVANFLSYDDFVRSRTNDQRSLQDAIAGFAEARKSLYQANKISRSCTVIGSWLHADVQNLIKTAVANSVALNKTTQTVSLSAHLVANPEPSWR